MKDSVLFYFSFYLFLFILFWVFFILFEQRQRRQNVMSHRHDLVVTQVTCSCNTMEQHKRF